MGSSNAGVSASEVREILREEVPPLIREQLEPLAAGQRTLLDAVGQLAEGQRVLLEDVAEIKQTVRDHERRITALERSV